MTLEPFKVVAQVVAIRKDEDGNVIGELNVGTVTLYKHQFGDLEGAVSEAWPKVVEQFDASDQNAIVPVDGD